ncbi:hypothetical protein H0G86_010593 [Trichoderma simmonsii]|uniref:Uncharacterized protein n=1 Tax=Trichoderma simmonsii TaxID=1491479 RepID=A0A8G0LMQ7_9HYPO|nr:hypothetical protein H0G86_010593 [Trichoderma simmonsii]
MSSIRRLCQSHHTTLAAIAAAAFETEPEIRPEEVIEVIPATQPGADGPGVLVSP